MWVATLNHELIAVDVATGDAVLVGTFEPDLYDIAFSPLGELYGVTRRDLYRVNTETGAATLVGAFDLGSTVGINALTFDSEGTLFAASSQRGNLYQIDTANGDGSLIGPLGVGSAGDVTFDRLGRLVLTTSTNRLYEINTDTGAATLIGPLNISGVYGVARAPNGQLYGVADREILAVDTITGESNVIWDYSTSGWGDGGGAAFPLEASLPYLAGDYQPDGHVGASDLAAWQTGFGGTGPYLAADGDFNGLVDGGDFLLWQRSVVDTSARVAAAAVPEPSGLVLMACLGGLFGSRLRRSFLSLAYF